MQSFAELEGHFAHSFQNLSLFRTALTHRSYVREHPEEGPDNERLEFLGDAVLQLIVTHLLLEKNPHLSEGVLSALRSRLVNQQFLSTMAKKAELGGFLRIGKSEESSLGREKPSLLSDAYEAIIGALYTEIGFEKTLTLFRRLWANEIERMSLVEARDSKSLLQELVQAHRRAYPRYEVLAEEGLPHQKVFEVGVFVDERLVATAKGRSKREAEQHAAHLGLQSFREERKPK